MDKKIDDVVRFRIAINTISGIGIKKAFKIVAKVRDEAEVKPEELPEIASGIPNIPRITVAQVTEGFDQADSILDRCEELSIAVIPTLYGKNPMPVEFIDDPPLVLYVRGDKELLYRDDSIAIVGTRNPNEWSSRVAGQLTQRCVGAQRVIVSGLAMGCDAVAHKKAIESEGLTIAVLAHGLDSVYPEQHRGMAEDILDSGGALVSEYAPGKEVRKHHFRDRDRIQSGLSAGVIPVQTTPTGGTMITARAALVQGRELAVLAVGQGNVPIKDHPGDDYTGNLKILEEGGRELRTKSDLASFLEATAGKGVERPLWIQSDPDTVTPVVSLWDYVPTWRTRHASPDQQTWHRLILAVKKKEPEAVRHTAEQLSKVWKLLRNPDTIVVVPSSNAENLESGIGQVAAKLSALTGANYMEGALVRVKSLPKSAYYRSSRNRKLQRDSMQFTVLTSEDGPKRILLLDDVYTSGSTMGAGLDLIKDAMNKSVQVTALSLGRTFHPLVKANPADLPDAADQALSIKEYRAGKRRKDEPLPSFEYTAERISDQALSIKEYQDRHSAWYDGHDLPVSPDLRESMFLEYWSYRHWENESEACRTSVPAPNVTIKAVIFDLDNTLCDTSQVESFRDSRKWKAIDPYYKSLKLYDSVGELLDYLYGEQIKIGVVTSSPRNYAEKVLAQLDVQYDTLVAYHDTSKHKPHPEPIKKAIHDLGVKSCETLSIGDLEADRIASNLVPTLAFCYATWAKEYGPVRHFGRHGDTLGEMQCVGSQLMGDIKFIRAVTKGGSNPISNLEGRYRDHTALPF